MLKASPGSGVRRALLAAATAAMILPARPAAA
ncbi:MAG: hypothetical protein QOJ16_3741, partial [Acidobacteriota bacterium]|nr:hypothetical protein [Acidobacteriota bacterium]